MRWYAAVIQDVVVLIGNCLDFIKDNVEKWYPQLKPYVKITLLELLDHILSTYDAKISACTYTTDLYFGLMESL
jgi:NADH dehydrogenase FAD-containing subunit